MKTQLKQLLTLLDLTSLNDDDTAEKIHTFAQQAVTPYGNVAAVCIYPRLSPPHARHWMRYRVDPPFLSLPW